MSRLGRRRFLNWSGLAGAGWMLAGGSTQAQPVVAPATTQPLLPPGPLVETPDLPRLPWRRVDGVKEFHLMAEPVRREFVPG